MLKYDSPNDLDTTLLPETEVRDSSTVPAHEASNSQLEAADSLIDIGQLGEYIAASMGTLVFAPWINYATQALSIPLSEKNNALQLSLMSIVLSIPFVLLSMHGAAYCHRQLEILPRLQKNILRESEIEAGKSDNPTVEITTRDSYSIRFSMIQPADAKLSNYQYMMLIGDWLAHFVEYVGLWLFIINLYVENKSSKLAFSTLCTLVAGIAALPEWLTCKNTLRDINAHENNQFIDANAQKNPQWMDHLIIFSAFAKGMPVLLASALNFQQIFLGNLFVGFLAAVYTTMSNMHCQYMINMNSKTTGQKHVPAKQPVVEYNRIEKQLLSLKIVEKETLNEWKNLPLSQKFELPGCGISTGTERAEPFLFILFLFVNLSKSAESGISAALLLLATGTTGSFVRNALTNMNTYNSTHIKKGYNCFGLLKGAREKITESRSASPEVTQETKVNTA